VSAYWLYLESGPKHRKTMVHVLDPLGRVAVGPTTEAALDATPVSKVAFTRREIRELLGWSEHQVRVGLALLVALEYLLVAPGGPGRHHRYRLAEPREPRGTPREVRESDSRGEMHPQAGETADPAELCDAYGQSGEESVVVGVGADRNGDLR